MSSSELPTWLSGRTPAPLDYEIIDLDPDAILALDLQGRVLALNKGAVRLYGWLPEEATGKVAHTLLQTRFPSGMAEALEAVGRRGEWRGELICRKRSGEEIHVDSQWTARRDREGNLIGTVEIDRDITEQKLLAEQLRIQASALEASADAMVITDANGTIIWINRAFSEMTGYSREEAVGQNPRLLKSGKHDKAFYADLWTTIQSGRVWRGEVENRKKDGSGYTEQMSITPVRSDTGAIKYFIAVKHDVTETKRLQAQYYQAQKMEALGRLVAGLAHDFNNLVAVILGSVELSEEQLPEGSPVAKNLLQIKTAGQRAASLNRQLLGFTRQQVVFPVTLDLNTVVSNLNTMMLRLVGEDISISFKPSAPLGAIMADPTQIEQILLNLVVNARDAMPDGGEIVIETRNTDLDDSYCHSHEPVRPGPYVMLSVSDTGCGMDEATKARIFEPFFTTKPSGKGTGLGLATAYGIVKQCEGFIWVYSELGKGTTFKIYFPRVHAHDQKPFEAAPDLAPVEVSGTATILLVEDDEAVREVTASFLRSAGYRVLQTGDPDEALQMVQDATEAVHLLLSDVIMPKMSGVDLSQRLRAVRPDLRVVLMSGYAGDALARQKIRAPDLALLEKPFSKRSLLAKVHAILRTPGQGAAG